MAITTKIVDSFGDIQLTRDVLSALADRTEYTQSGVVACPCGGNIVYAGGAVLRASCTICSLRIVSQMKGPKDA